MKCSTCKAEKPATEFHKDRTRVAGLSKTCKPCKCANVKLWAKRHPWQERAKKDLKRIRNRSWVKDYLTRHPCVDCGEADPVVLEFDHVRGNKTCDVAKMVQNRLSVETIIGEIEKCEVRCANCHRRVTRKRKALPTEPNFVAKKDLTLDSWNTWC